jgi:hypothetical protein
VIYLLISIKFTEVFEKLCPVCGIFVFICTTLCDKVCQRLAAESVIKHHKTIYYFHLGTVKGKRLLDIGCGPTIHNVMPAAKWFDEIIL